MKVYFILILFFLLTPCMDSLAWESYVGRTLTGTVESLEPGNIMVIKSGKRTMSVRFYGVGIPTEKQPFGEEARRILSELIPKGTKIIVTTVNEDNEGIISALVQYKDHSINNMLVDKGLAWVDRRTCKAFFCRRWHIQEHLAITERRGLWSLNLSSPPWQWGE